MVNKHLKKNMAGKIQNVVFQAIKTFNNASRTECNVVEEAKFNKLVALVDELRFTDLSIPSRLLNKNDETLRSKDPVAHLSYFENQDVTVGVFILKQGAKIPLHDHPDMHGLLRVLHGTVQVTSYSLIESPSSIPSSPLLYTSPLKAIRNPTIALCDTDGCSRLTPSLNNIHEVTCVVGPAAFLDILSPPYSDDFNESAERSCHYFSEVGKTDGGAVYLKQIPCPGNYWTDQNI